MVGGLEPWIFYDFPDKYWEWKIIPTDELTPSFFRGVGGSTTNQIIINHHKPSSLTIMNSILTTMVGGSTTNQDWIFSGRIFVMTHADVTGRWLSFGEHHP